MFEMQRSACRQSPSSVAFLHRKSHFLSKRHNKVSKNIYLGGQTKNVSLVQGFHNSCVFYDLQDSPLGTRGNGGCNGGSRARSGGGGGDDCENRESCEEIGARAAA